MGDNQQLRAAAERYRNWAYGAGEYMNPPPGTSRTDDMELLADAYISYHRDDDGDAVTEEWLMLVGFICRDCPRRGCRVAYFLKDDTEYYDVWYSPHYHDDFKGQWFLGKRHISITTRGQLRQLAKCLGLSLKESTQ